LRRSLRAGLMVNIMLNTIFLLFALGNAAAFAVGAWLFEAQALTIGAVYIIFHYTMMLERPLTQITRQLEDLQKASAGMVRIQELFRSTSRLDERDSGRRLPEGALTVEFRNVSFGYGTDAAGLCPEVKPGEEPELAKEMVLRDLSFRLRAGRVLGLLGRTGSGKTTVTRLLFRLYDPDTGAVRLGDGAGLTDIRELPLAELRRRVGMVTQNIELFHASVRDNLTFFDASIPDQRILDVIKDVGLWEWYETLPEGLDSVLESGGGSLSAGEAQLLAFMRIFLQNPGLVILDEASSRLDPATEQLIERAVDRLVGQRTAIIIAHRLGTIQRADEILILEDGAISEQGARATLVCDPASRLSSLLRTGLEEVLA
jgi:ATP-binding cassette subfamily B protein